MKTIANPIADVRVIETTPHSDDRGSFTETYHREKLAALGIPDAFVQDNESVSAKAGTIRGLHMQVAPSAQGKLVRCLRGEIVDVFVDLRTDSPTYLQHDSVTLQGDDALLLWIPAGFAHGFCTLEPDTVVAYKVTAPYDPSAERSVRWDDPDLAIEWPDAAAPPVLSAKDAAAPLLADIESELRW